MKDGICPKCAAPDARKIESPFGRDHMPFGAFRSARLYHFVCVHCGYVESYIEDADTLRDIAEKYPPVAH